MPLPPVELHQLPELEWAQPSPTAGVAQRAWVWEGARGGGRLEAWSGAPDRAAAGWSGGVGWGSSGGPPKIAFQ